MTVRKAWLSWGGSYELDIKARDEILPSICLLLAIELAWLLITVKQWLFSGFRLWYDAEKSN
jgi:hypothetical protein